MNNNKVEQKEDMNIVIVGHVDHGKSTIIGRLLADTGSLPQGKLEQVREMCRRNSKPFEYAFLLDALKDERDQGITIDSARCFFKTQRRNYILIDAPGHIEFLKNMVTGAARAEAALLVIDANEGIQENSRRHGYLLSMLGISQLCVLVNKMDLVGYDEAVYKNIVGEYMEFLSKINITPSYFIPVSGFNGENVVNRAESMQWFDGPTVLEALERFSVEGLPEDKPFRMPVQGVYKFTNAGDDRRIIAGTIDTGKVSVGDEIVFYPSGKKTRVKTIEGFNKEKQMSANAGYAAGFTVTEQIYVKRGEMAVLPNQLKPKVTTRLNVNLFWLGKDPMETGKEYFLKLGTARVGVRLEKIIRVIDASKLENKDIDAVNRHDVAECILKADKAISFDEARDIAQTSRFVIVDNYEIAGGGIIIEALEDKQSWVRNKVLLRNYKWETSDITDEERAEKYNQKSRLIIITGPKEVDKKKVAKALERRLFADGKIVYFLGIGNVLYGLDADIKKEGGNHREEHMRRLAEVAHILLDAGAILIVTAIDLTQDDLEIIKTIVNPDKTSVVWLGENIKTDIACNLQLPSGDDIENSVNKIKGILQDKGIIFKPD